MKIKRQNLQDTKQQNNENPCNKNKTLCNKTIPATREARGLEQCKNRGLEHPNNESGKGPATFKQ